MIANLKIRVSGNLLRPVRNIVDFSGTKLIKDFIFDFEFDPIIILMAELHAVIRNVAAALVVTFHMNGRLFLRAEVPICMFVAANLS